MFRVCCYDQLHDVMLSFPYKTEMYDLLYFQNMSLALHNPSLVSDSSASTTILTVHRYCISLQLQSQDYQQCTYLFVTKTLAVGF